MSTTTEQVIELNYLLKFINLYIKSNDMTNSSGYFYYEFQKKIIADAYESGIDLDWVRQRFCFVRIIGGKYEFILKRQVNYNYLQDKINGILLSITYKRKKEIYDKIQKETINRDEAIDFNIKKKIGFSGGFGIYVSAILRKMCWVDLSEVRELLEDDYRSNGRWIPETLDDEVCDLYGSHMEYLVRKFKIFK